MKPAATIAVAAILLASVSAVSLAWLNLPRHAVATPTTPVWSEVSWPFPVDPWGKGKSFRCNADDCGVEVTVHLRAKIGFCDCTKGVADDDDLDRMGDTTLLGDVSPLAPGRQISIAWMKGRSRTYALNLAVRPARHWCPSSTTNVAT